jgi:molybdopterin converting factor small subunit
VSVEVTVRLFAAARAAAGTSVLSVPPGPIGRQLADLGLGERFTEVLAMSTLLTDGRRLSPGDAVAAGAVVDVLPPFAGG